MGKTHFWQNEIASDELKLELKKENKACHYVSLYGKKSIEEIENELFLKVYSSVGGIDEKVSKIYTNISFIAKKITKTTKNISEIVDKFKSDYEKNHAEDFLLNGGIICFDDFERKSKDIDLNDLFGFITQLTLNFNCKVVIILNDDVFEGEEKKIFSNVKEKSVSKFLYYNPTIEELFNMIFQKHDICNFKEDLINPIREIIEETNILNARIYNQVLDNLLEWLKINIKTSDYPERRCLVLVNINFILYHTVCDYSYHLKEFQDLIHKDYNNEGLISKSVSFNHFESNVKEFLLRKTAHNEKQRDEHISFFYKNINSYKSIYFFRKLDIREGVNLDKFNEINNFIETGILID